MPDIRKPPPPWTRVGQKLRSDAPGTMAPMIRFFDHLETDSEFAGVVNDAMTGGSSIVLVEAFPA